MFKVVFFIVSILTTESITMSCENCDPDIPSRQTPKQWYREEILNTTCTAGQYLDSQNQCKTCLVGTFMTAAMARTVKYIFCEPCLKVLQEDIEKIVTPCNSTRDTEMRCMDGLYRSLVCVCEWECLRCSTCGEGTKLNYRYKKRACSQDSDTICCPNEDDELASGTCVPKTDSENKDLNSARTPVDTTTASGHVNDAATTNHNLNELIVCLGLLALVIM